MVSLDSNISGNNGKVPFSNNLNLLNIIFLENFKKDENTPQDPIVFFCKNCKNLVPVTKNGKKLSFICKKCHNKNIPFGTKSSIENFYHLNN